MSSDSIDLDEIAEKLVICTDTEQMRELVDFLDNHANRGSAVYRIWYVMTVKHAAEKTPCEVLNYLNMFLEVLCSFDDISNPYTWLGWKYKPTFFSPNITKRVKSLSAFFDCLSEQKLRYPLNDWLTYDADFMSRVKNEIETLEVRHLLWILDYGPWSIFSDILERRPEVFDQMESSDSLQIRLESNLKEATPEDLFSEDPLNAIFSKLVNSENEHLKRFLDTMLRLYCDVHHIIHDDDVKRKIASNQSFQRSIAKLIEDDNVGHALDAIISLSKYPEFSESPIVVSSIERQQHSILDAISDGFYFFPRMIIHPWDLYQSLAKFPCFAQNESFLEIMSNSKPYVAHACYIDEFEFIVDNEKGYGVISTSSEVVLEAISSIPFFLQDQDIQLGIARALRTKKQHNWLAKLKSEELMRSNPLILAALQAPIIEDSMKSLVQQIIASNVPLLMIQEVLANNQFRRRADVMDEVEKRIPEIVSMIETAEPYPDDWTLGLVSLILYLVEDRNLLEYPAIKNAIEKRLPEFQNITSFQHPQYMTMVNQKLVDMTDKAAQIWQGFPAISSLTFVLDEGVSVYQDLPEELPDTIELDDYNQIDLASRIRQVVESGGQSVLRILIILLEQLMKQVRDSTYVYGKIAGGYDRFTPGIVWCTVLDWVIVHLHNNHDATVVRPLIEVLRRISEFLGEEWLSDDIFRILSHYLSSDKLNTLRSQYDQKQLRVNNWS